MRRLQIYRYIRGINHTKEEGGDLMEAAGYVLCGYLSGSVLYARVFARIFKKENMIENSKDKNPGTANAFMHGGFWCGVLTLIFDLLKGFLPVFLYIIDSRGRNDVSVWLPFVMAAPVVGHAFPLFHHLRGGKGIATTFGSLLGLLPVWQPAVALAVFFIFFSLILRITPHFQRTLFAYLCALVCMTCMQQYREILIGFLMITAAVGIRMFKSPEKREKMRVNLLWMF